MTILTPNSQTGIMEAPSASGSGQNFSSLSGQGGTPSPYAALIPALTSLLGAAQGQTNANNTAQTQAREQVQNEALNASNPLVASPLQPFLTGTAGIGNQSAIQGAFDPAIKSINDTMTLNNQNMSNATDLVNSTANMASAQATQENAATAAYNASKPNWQLSPQPNADGDFYYFNSNTPPGQQMQIYTPGQVPPTVSGGTGNGAVPEDHQTLLSANNLYGIKVSASTMSLFQKAGLSPSPGPAATDGGNFIAFANPADSDKAARVLLQSPVYASDTVDQALRAWSNYTGTGQYPGYNSSILAGTGIDPNTIVSDLGGAQIDTVLSAMKKAENVGGAQTQASPSASSGSSAGNTQAGVPFDQLRASAPAYVTSALNQVQSTGSAYIDSSKIPPAFQNAVTGWAKQNNNIPILTPDQVSNAQNTDEAIRNILDVVAPAWAQIAPDSPLGRASEIASGPWGAIGDTKNFSLNKTFAENTESLAQQISALSKSAPKLGLLQIGESALPTNAAYMGNGVQKLAGALFGTGYDTYQDGVNKMNRTLQLLQESLNTYVPGGNQISLLSTSKSGSGGTATAAPTTSNGVDLSQFEK